MFRSTRRLWTAAFALGLLCSVSAFSKNIHLKNEIIRPQNPGRSEAQAMEPGHPTNGLFLIQFAGPPSQELRTHLSQDGYELLNAVPEDAYIARAKNANPGKLRKFPEVLWVGRYRPEHKVHKNLAAAKARQEATDVRVLLAPGASPAEVTAARRAFGRLNSESTIRPGTVLKGRLNAGQLEALAQSESVLWIEPERPMRLFDEAASKLVAGDGGPHTLLTQSLGYDGSGVKVAVADSGLNNGDAESMHPDLLGRTPAFFYYGVPGQLEDAADYHSHGTHVAGIIAGNGATGETDENGLLYGLGVAPGAAIIAQKLFDDAGGYAPPPSFERMTRDAKRAGADVGSNSWGDDTYGEYDISAMEFDALVRDADALTLGDQEYILEFSAGNAGPAPGTIGSPAVAKNVLATGASESDRTEFLIYGDGPEVMADFSSRGPAKDGRIKPDIVAPGTYIASLQSQSATDVYAWAPISGNYQYQGGTSQAGPHASGAAAVFVQYYRQQFGSTPSPALVKAALINSAVDLDDSFGTAPVPNMDEGWGRLDLPALFDPALNFQYVDQVNLLTNAQVYEQRVIVSVDAEPLKITLAYTDVPGTPSAAQALINDLDLEVIAPDGSLYRGNQFLNGVSVPNASASDTLNNVEGIMIWEPLPGEWVVRVRARKLLDDARVDTTTLDQDFALVLSSTFAPAGHGQITLDRKAYRAPDVVKILLADTDLAGAQTVSVRLTSETEALGEPVLLRASGSHGAFTGAVLTATGSALQDGKLQVAHGNTLAATYEDASPRVTRTANARADLVPPVLSSVLANISFGTPQVNWTSSEPATSTVYFGTNAALLNITATDRELATSHSVNLGHVLHNVTYYYYVVSSDEAGNSSTNNNNGAFYTFQAAMAGPLLLVDGWPDDPMMLGAPPLTGYTEPLNQLGLPYDVWDMSLLGSPINVLENYGAVVWRLSEFGDPWTQAERSALSNYLHNGGALLVASMEVISRIEEAGDTNFLANVLHVSSYIPDATVSDISGNDGDPLFQGFESFLNYQVYEDLWGGFIPSDISDVMTPGPNASALLHDSYGDVAGLRWPAIGQDAPGRLCLLGFPLDAVPISDRVVLLRKLVSFLLPGSSREALLTFGSPAYKVPGKARISLTDADLADVPSITLTVRKEGQSSGVAVQLLQSSIRGELVGYLEIVPGSPGPNQIAAVNGDVLVVEYFDETAGAPVRATTRIDTALPIISNISVEPEYLDAVVYWDTSEPTDSTVLFGEGTFLERTAYSSRLENSHAVALPGLSPDRVYYYKIASKDAAGNVTVDDNSGQLYSFRTLKPLQAPWADNMNTGAAGWTTYSDPEVSGGGGGFPTPDWTLGVPSNGVETEAHSSPHCWGSNLSGNPLDSAEMFLISPAIFLPSGSGATLQFWHNYEFNDYSGFDFEMGAIQISVNNGPLQDLASYMDWSFGWEQESIDLSPYAGKMVYIVWHYMLLGFETGPRPGWLVDDVSITTSTAVNGTVQITNNLWGAEYLLSGALSRRAKGPLSISNAPPGTYYLEYIPVPYYNEPAPQTNVLAPGGSIVFQGNYSFPDVNNNKMSDLWEQQVFGAVSPTRTAQTDSDGDSITDLEEFLVGTNPLNSDQLTIRAESLNDAIRLTWPTTPGRWYQLEASTNLVNWSTVSPWTAATGPAMTNTLPKAGARSTLYRWQARP